MDDNIVERFKLLTQWFADQKGTREMLFLADQPEPLLEYLHAIKPSLDVQIECFATDVVAADMGVLGDRRWPMVCLLEPELDKPSLINLLARVRDLHADRVIHINGLKHWLLADSLALGFSQLGFSEVGFSEADGLPAEPPDDAGLQIFAFDIRSYKPAPDWLNSKNWANPEQWDKHRW